MATAWALNLSATYATEQMSLRYDGSTAEADNYKAARDFKAAGPAASDKPSAVAGGRRGGIVQLQDPQPFARVCLAQ
jgi:hypothetical protein